jgi:mono/diheme cytochrome c family protein
MKAGFMSLVLATALNLISPAGVAQQASVTGGKASVWSGIYTKAQNERGEGVHSASCASCHGTRLNGAGQPDMPPSPAIAREGFLRKWAGRNVAELFEYVRTKMPPDAPGRLGNQETADAIAHMFAMSNMPAGDKELPTDTNALAELLIEVQRK